MHLLKAPLRVGPGRPDSSSPSRILAQAHSSPRIHSGLEGVALQVAPDACCCGPECSWPPQQMNAEKTVHVLAGRLITGLSSGSAHLFCLTGFWTGGPFG